MKLNNSTLIRASERKCERPTILLILFFACISQHSYTQILFEIDSAKGETAEALRVAYSDNIGMRVLGAGNIGVKLDGIYEEGISIGFCQKFGISMLVGGDGIYIGQAQNAIKVGNAFDTGFDLKWAGNYGIRIRDADIDGILVDRADGYSLNINGNKNRNPAAPSDHVAIIRNWNGGNGPDVLALKVEPGNPTASSNFISFFDGFNNRLGEIEGNGSGGISFVSNGADFAEYVPVLSLDEQFEAGDIVGLVNGKITKQTSNSDHLMVISDRPIVIGNKQEKEGHEIVSFIGQVPVKVMGPVSAGDWIVAYGESNGIGMAKSSTELNISDKIVGRAWETHQGKTIKKINVAVGLDQSIAKDHIIRQLEELIYKQQEQIDRLLELIPAN